MVSADSKMVSANSIYAPAAAGVVAARVEVAAVVVVTMAVLLPYSGLLQQF